MNQETYQEIRKGSAARVLARVSEKLRATLESLDVEKKPNSFSLGYREGLAAAILAIEDAKSKATEFDQQFRETTLHDYFFGEYAE